MTMFGRLQILAQFANIHYLHYRKCFFSTFLLRVTWLFFCSFVLHFVFIKTKPTHFHRQFLPLNLSLKLKLEKMGRRNVMEANSNWDVFSSTCYIYPLWHFWVQGGSSSKIKFFENAFYQFCRTFRFATFVVENNLSKCTAVIWLSW